MTRAFLVLQALFQMARYDLVNSMFGFQRIHRQLARRGVSSRRFHPEYQACICESVTLAACFYYKPVMCLERSVVVALLLRQHGIDGRLVIGYRASPFFSHAWVEVDGFVVNDSPAYKERLQVLCTA